MTEINLEVAVRFQYYILLTTTETFKINVALFEIWMFQYYILLTTTETHQSEYCC